MFEVATGALLYTLTNPVPHQYAGFGGRVAVSGTRVVVGAPRDYTLGTNAGIIYVYDLASATPTEPLLTLTNPIPATNAYFPRSLAFSGSRVVAGANWISPGLPQFGIAYVFDLNSNTPTVPVVTLTDPAPDYSVYFGDAVAISGSRVVVSAPYAYRDGFSSGAVWVYDLGGVTPNVPVFEIDHFDIEEEIFFGTAVAIDGTRVVIDSVTSGFGPGCGENVRVYDLASPMCP